MTRAAREQVPLLPGHAWQGSSAAWICVGAVGVRCHVDFCTPHGLARRREGRRHPAASLGEEARQPEASTPQGTSGLSADRWSASGEWSAAALPDAAGRRAGCRAGLRQLRLGTRDAQQDERDQQHETEDRLAHDLSAARTSGPSFRHQRGHPLVANEPRHPETTQRSPGSHASGRRQGTSHRLPPRKSLHRGKLARRERLRLSACRGPSSLDMIVSEGRWNCYGSTQGR